MDVIIKTLEYISCAPYFWSAMGMTTAIAIFIGALLYDGNVTQTRKGIISILSYVGLLLFVTQSRISYYMNIGEVGMYHQAYAGIATIFIITFFWILGIILGVTMFRIKKWRQ